MCGIAGVYDPHHHLRPAIRLEGAARMVSRLAHRGPNDDGLMADEQAGLALGFRRLAVLDAGPGGAQPMQSADGRCWLVCDGEIYNQAALRAAHPAAWRGRNSVEPLLEALAAEGPVATLPQLDGMFALAFWQSARQRLTLARDRMGEKPLFWSLAGGVLSFASEIKALLACPWIEPQPDRRGIALLLRQGWIAAPFTAFAGIFRLPAAHMLSFDPNLDPGEPEAYWDAATAAAVGLFEGSEKEAEAELAQRLRLACATRREADVPLGLMLSGGVNSALVAASMVEGGLTPRCFSILLPGPSMPGAPPARAIAQHLRLPHTEIPVTEAEALSTVAEMPEIWDEPFADPAAIPTLLLARAATMHVTIGLTGDGGNELFGGLARHQQAVTHHPSWLGHFAGLAPDHPRHVGTARLGRRLVLAADTDPMARHRAGLSLWHDSDGLSPMRPPRGLLDEPRLRPRGLSAMRQAMWLDSRTVLPDGGLTRLDRAGMAASLQFRAPLLANDLVAFAARLPDRMLRDAGGGEALLRRVLARRVPSELFEVPELRFEPPLAEWLRGSLRPWADGLLGQRRLAQSGLLDNAPLVARCWAEHRGGLRDHAYRLWAILMLMGWAERHGFA